MRYLYAMLLVVLAGFHTFTTGASTPGDDDDDNSGDNQNYLEVNANGALNFSITQPENLEQKQTINNAIRLKFKSKRSDCSMFARVSDYTTPSGANKSNVPLELLLRSNDAKKINAYVNAPIQLTTTDRMLFSIEKNSSTNNFDYDLSLLPLGYDYPEGQYNFTLMFTMTQP